MVLIFFTDTNSIFLFDKISCVRFAGYLPSDFDLSDSTFSVGSVFNSNGETGDSFRGGFGGLSKTCGPSVRSSFTSEGFLRLGGGERREVLVRIRRRSGPGLGFLDLESFFDDLFECLLTENI